MRPRLLVTGDPADDVVNGASKPFFFVSSEEGELAQVTAERDAADRGLVSWEQRALKAEAERDRLRRVIRSNNLDWCGICGTCWICKRTEKQLAEGKEG